MKINLETLSREELVALRRDVEMALTNFDRRKKKEALAAAQKAALEHGFSLDDIFGGRAGGSKSAPRYANPADPSQTWTGRGRQPHWIKDALAAGKSLDELAI